MAGKLITENFAYEGGAVDRTGARPVIRGVLLCGASSANRRRYRKEAFAGDRVKKYDGRPVYVGHSDGRRGRVYGEQLGWVRNPRLREDGMPVGDIEVKPKHPLAEQFLDDAVNDPKAVGMSHVARCDTSTAADGWEDVRAVEEVASVDVVLDPATTKGLYEEKGRIVKTTLTKLIESLLPKLPAERAKPLRKWLVLSEDDASMAPVMGSEVDAPAEDADPNDAITGGFKAAIDAIVDQVLAGKMDRKEGRKKIDKLFDSHGDATGSAPAAKSGGEGEGEGDAAEESRKKPADRFAIVEELQKEFGPEFSPGLALMEALVLLPTPAARKALVVEHRAGRSAPQDPKSGTRYKPLSESIVTGNQKSAEDVKGFLSRVTS